MLIEIEHKYLIIQSEWEKIVPEKSEIIKQAYLHSDPDKTIRIRTKGAKGFITIKGKTKGTSRPEYEYEIPLEDANELIRNFTKQLIEKTRHYILFEGKLWEVDVFEGENKGLIVAEIELQSETETYSIPHWIGENVTSDKRYANSNLAKHPFRNW
jgi:adenylate cyclase